ncbi:MAG: sodium:calcium antiporter [Candidatus Woesearchaeota archaeon]
MALLINILFFLVFCIFLIISGAICVRSLAKISSFLGMSEFVVGFIIMALSTTIPELFVGINSALNNNPSLSLGNVIGSNIVNLSLIAGISVLTAGKIVCKQKEIKKDAIYMTLIALVPMVLMYLGNKLSRIDGILLITLFLLFSFRIYKRRKIHAAKQKNNVSRVSAVINTAIFMLSIFLLFVFSKQIVKYSSFISSDLGLPLIFIGIFFVAIGTSLPELVFSISAVKKGHSSFMLGDIIGAVIVNSTLVLGITAVISPISANFFLFLSSSLFMAVTCLIFATFIESGNKLSTTEGISLIFIYILFIVIELSLAGVVPSTSVINISGG